MLEENHIDSTFSCISCGAPLPRYALLESAAGPKRQVDISSLNIVCDQCAAKLAQTGGSVS